ncbi:Outer membrane usher protein PapC [Klebsiella huaxiensis]|nr:Outer membrane usher protein PapC [Klebsiella huaxiensis]
MTSLKTSIKTITYLSDIGCLEIQGASLSDKEYVTMNEYINSRNGDDSSSNEKESYVLSFNQYVAPLAVNTYLSVTRNTYWNSETNTNYSFSI